MLEEMTDDQLRTEHVRALQLARICDDRGYSQAATIHSMTALAIAAELQTRLAAT